MSWQTPLRTAHASVAVVCTPVTPCMYSTASPIMVQIFSPASQGPDAVAAISAACSATSEGGSVRRVCFNCSTYSVEVAAATARSSQLRS